MMLPVRKPGAVAGNAATPDNQYPRFDIPGVSQVSLTGHVTERGPYGVHSQDTIHNAKKLINPMDQTARTLQIGLHMCTWEHMGLVLARVPASEHDLRRQEVERKDRQNFEVVQRACSPRTRAALLRAGAMSGEDVQGTHVWLTMVHEYLLAFFGKKVTLHERVRLL